jgi:MFS superfamily sulfate permease-like transporter
MEDEEALRQLDDKSEPMHDPLHSSSGSTSLRRTASETPEKKSCWEFESTTPMTTRPHFSPHRSPRSPSPPPTPSLTGLRRRSRSLGAEAEAQRHLKDRSLLIPHLRTIKSQQAIEICDSDDNDQETAEALLPDRYRSSRKEAIDSESLAIDSNSSSSHEENGDSKSESTPLGICIIYGMINATIILPILISFASIIYQDDAFSPYMPVLVKLTMFSGIVHQLCFSTFSSLPFAVGQVQDAGLIFLSSMTAWMANYCRSHGNDDETLLATVTVSLALGTALLGCALMLIGRWNLAQYVRMLPTCVVAGYLAYIGFFCGVSGVRLMAGGNELSIYKQWRLVLPGVLGGLLLYITVRRLRHMAVLPVCILLLLLMFYVVLWITDTSLPEAAQQGWVRAMEPPPPLGVTWSYLRFDKVLWSVLPHLLLTELGMIVVVAVSSSLDVAAIEIELKRPLDYDRELTTVGISNLISGLTGGYTGSYIFSQTIFSLRAGIKSRAAGYALAACQTVVLVMPFPFLSYVPNFFFGALLSMICVDLMYEWLWDVRTRLTTSEYCVDLATFGMILWLGIEYGIAAGVVVYVACQKLGLESESNTGYENQDAGADEGGPAIETVLEEDSLEVKTITNGHGKTKYGSL